MTKEENLHWIDQEIQTWENECQSKHPIKEALYAARKALKQEPTLEKDGTLIVTTEHCGNVGRVLVQYGTNGTLFYQDQEPMVEIDLYSVIKQKYIEREVLDEIRAEIESTMKYQYATGDNQYAEGFEKSLEIIDKYKAESEERYDS